MKRIHTQWARRVAALGLVVGLTAGLQAAGVAQSVSGRAYGAYASTPLGSTAQAPLAVLPYGSGTDGNVAHAESDGLSAGGALSADFLNSITSGATGRWGDASAGGAQSVASVGTVNILSGLITATGVIANVASTRTASGAVSDANGSSFSNLVVAGTPVTSGEGTVAPNTRMNLPNVGYVVLNEQTLTGDGVTSSGITVNMIHVVMQQPILGLLGQVIGYQTVGNIIVGSASSGVN
jgi:hypothetical protein